MTTTTMRYFWRVVNTPGTADCAAAGLAQAVSARAGNGQECDKPVLRMVSFSLRYAPDTFWSVAYAH